MLPSKGVFFDLESDLELSKTYSLLRSTRMNVGLCPFSKNVLSLIFPITLGVVLIILISFSNDIIPAFTR